MRNLTAKRPAALAATILALTGCEGAMDQTVRPGHLAVEITERYVPRETDRWIMTLHAPNGVAVRHIVTSSGTSAEWSTERYEIELAEPDRGPMWDWLYHQDVANLEITETGVSYAIYKEFDPQRRTTSRDGAWRKRLVPHDCSRVLGECSFTASSDGDAVTYVRTSEFKNGVWSDQLHMASVEPGDAKGELVEERRFSVDTRGVLLDMEMMSYKDGEVTRTTWQHQERSPAPPPLIPDGYNSGIQLSCSESGSAAVMIGSNRFELGTDKPVTQSVASGTGVKLLCQAADDLSTTEMTCPDTGVLQAAIGRGKIAAGCYKGALPTNEEAEG